MTRNPRQIEAKSLTGFSAAAGKQGMIDTLNHGVTGTTSSSSLSHLNNNRTASTPGKLSMIQIKPALLLRRL